jgi:hypothetical protein
MLRVVRPTSYRPSPGRFSCALEPITGTHQLGVYTTCNLGRRDSLCAGKLQSL